MTYEEFKIIIDSYKDGINKEFGVLIPYDCWKYVPYIDKTTGKYHGWIQAFDTWSGDDFESEQDVLDHIVDYTKWLIEVKDRLIRNIKGASAEDYRARIENLMKQLYQQREDAFILATKAGANSQNENHEENNNKPVTSTSTDEQRRYIKGTNDTDLKVLKVVYNHRGPQKITYKEIAGKTDMTESNLKNYICPKLRNLTNLHELKDIAQKFFDLGILKV